jgi:hypothetical protein
MFSEGNFYPDAEWVCKDQLFYRRTLGIVNSFSISINEYKFPPASQNLFPVSYRVVEF